MKTKKNYFIIAFVVIFIISFAVIFYTTRNKLSEKKKKEYNSSEFVIVDFGSCFDDKEQDACETLVVMNKKNINLKYVKPKKENKNLGKLLVNDIDMNVKLSDRYLEKLYNKIFLHKHFLVLSWSGGDTLYLGHIIDYSGTPLIENFTPESMLPIADKTIENYPILVDFYNEIMESNN